MPITSQDLVANHLEAVVRAAQARIDRYHAPEAPVWETEPALAVQDLAEILRGIRFTPTFPSLGRFVDDFLAKRHARQVTDINEVVWCPEWWQHAEALWKFGLLWEGYEHVRATGGPLEMSDFALHHIDPHMREMFDPRGPFKFCSVRHGHKDMLKPLPSRIDKAPDGLFAGPPTATATLTVA
ncbi:DUF4913 domain-containing protein [Nocardia sp. NPDC004168]|uniref:DUF4913 domain-containing protein n=1 Tax=Nocardia sp. NPDC004168 TaxID=3154452 RepID=UPI0033B458CF